MKTYSEVQQERAQQAREAYEAECARFDRAREYLERDVLSREIPLHAEATAERRQILRNRIRSANMPFVHATSVSCDHCATELFVLHPEEAALLGSRHVQCPGCGWSGYM